MSNPVVKIRDTGRNSSRTGDVRELADNVITSATSTTTGTIAVTAAAKILVSASMVVKIASLEVCNALVAAPVGSAEESTVV